MQHIVIRLYDPVRIWIVILIPDQRVLELLLTSPSALTSRAF